MRTAPSRRANRRMLGDGGGALTAARVPRVQLPPPVLREKSKGVQVRLTPCTRAEQRQPLIVPVQSHLTHHGYCKKSAMRSPKLLRHYGNTQSIGKADTSGASEVSGGATTNTSWMRTTRPADK